jgi:hypothetical protein
MQEMSAPQLSGKERDRRGKAVMAFTIGPNGIYTLDVIRAPASPVSTPRLRT